MAKITKDERKEFERLYDKLSPLDTDLRGALKNINNYCILFMEMEIIDIDYFTEKLDYIKRVVLNIELLTKRVIAHQETLGNKNE